MKIKQSSLNEIRALCDFVHTLPDRYQLITVKASDIRVGDVVTISPACYDDVPPRAQFVTEVKNTMYLVINGFVFEPDEDEIIMRKMIS